MGMMGIPILTTRLPSDRTNSNHSPSTKINTNTHTSSHLRILPRRCTLQLGNSIPKLPPHHRKHNLASTQHIHPLCSRHCRGGQGQVILIIITLRLTVRLRGTQLTQPLQKAFKPHHPPRRIIIPLLAETDRETHSKPQYGAQNQTAPADHGKGVDFLGGQRQEILVVLV